MVKKSNEEFIIQKAIIDYLDKNGYWWERANSGQAFVKNGYSTRKIMLMRRGCPDLLSCVDGQLVGIEVKKSEKEYKRWKTIIDKYREIVGDNPDLKMQWRHEILTYPEIKKSWEREIFQYKYAIRMTRGGGKYILTYSVEHLEEQLNKLKLK